MRNDVAWKNKASGFYANHSSGGNTWLNNTAYMNATQYNMLASPANNTDQTIILTGDKVHRMRNNVGFPNKNSNMGGVETMNNTWDLGITETNAFSSTSDAGATGPRQAVGSIPNLDFLKPKAGGVLIDRGVDVMLPYVGSAPDLGAYEYGARSTGGSGGMAGAAGMSGSAGLGGTGGAGSGNGGGATAGAAGSSAGGGGMPETGGAAGAGEMTGAGSGGMNGSAGTSNGGVSGAPTSGTGGFATGGSVGTTGGAAGASGGTVGATGGVVTTGGSDPRPVVDVPGDATGCTCLLPARSTSRPLFPSVIAGALGVLAVARARRRRQSGF